MGIDDDCRCVVVGTQKANILIGWKERSASDVLETVEEQNGIVGVGCENDGVGVIVEKAHFDVVVLVLSPGFRVGGGVFVADDIIMTGVEEGGPVDGWHGC